MEKTKGREGKKKRKKEKENHPIPYRQVEQLDFFSSGTFVYLALALFDDNPRTAASFDAAIYTGNAKGGKREEKRPFPVSFVCVRCRSCTTWSHYHYYSRERQR